VIGVVDALEPLNNRAAAFERKSALLAVGAQHAFLDRRMPIANTAEVADPSGDIDDVMVTLESSAKATPVDINSVAAAAEIVGMRMGRTPPLSSFPAIVTSRSANHSGFWTVGKTAREPVAMILEYPPRA
jgi:hypothetical protein